MDWQAVEVGGAFGVASLVFLSLRHRDRLRRVLGPKLYASWSELPRARKRAIRRALRSGSAVDDPRDAPIAARLASEIVAQLDSARQGRLHRMQMAIHSFVGLGLLASIALSITNHRWTAWLGLQVALFLAVLGMFIAARGLFDRRIREAQAARESNERLAHEYGLSAG